MSGRRRDVRERFWEKVEKTDGCWLWRGAVNNRGGYGKFKPRSYVMVTAHRFSYELNVGTIPEGLYVCHHCDTPACVRPDHLFVGTQTDNVRDMMVKGRHPCAAGWPRVKKPPRVRVSVPKPVRVAAVRPQRKTHCGRGHEFTPGNTYDYGNGRICRTCLKENTYRTRRLAREQRQTA